MVEVNQLIAIFNSLFNWLKAAADKRGQMDVDFKKALLAVYIASNETKSYISGLKLRKKPDRTREATLSRLWSEAAVELRQIDKKLADKCLLQGDYLAQATSWSDEEVDRARHSINDLFNHARKLL